TVTYWSCDLAGNEEGHHTLPVNIDTSAPTVAVGSATTNPNGAGWYSGPVTFPFTASDALSGIAGTTPSYTTSTLAGDGVTIASVAGTVAVSSEGASVTGTVSATDRAGNGASASTTAVRIDKTPPVTGEATSGTSTAGWYVKSATVTL